MSLDIICRRRDFLRSIEVLFAVKSFDGELLHVGQPLVFTTQERALISEPTFSLQPEDAQKLMDELWNCGIRPTEGSGSAGAFAAVENHRDDLRKLLFHTLGVK